MKSATRVRRLGAIVLLASALGGFAIAAVAAGTNAPVRPHLVVMKQSEIQGIVYFLADDDSSEGLAPDVRVEVWASDGSKMLASTVTDARGAYRLPSLDAGTYRLVVGRLILELRVQDPESIGAQMRRVPKTILVYIPRSLTPVSKTD